MKKKRKSAVKKLLASWGERDKIVRKDKVTDACAGEEEEHEEEAFVPEGAAVSISAVDESGLIINGQVKVNFLKKVKKEFQAR